REGGGRRQRPPRGGGGVQGLRAGAARGGWRRSDHHRHPFHEGPPVSTRIAILDYGMGNLRSAEKAFEHVGATVTVTRDHDAVRHADGLVLPGVGAFPKAMEAVRELEFDVLIAERLEAATPVLGICLGMQLLFASSTGLG